MSDDTEEIPAPPHLSLLKSLLVYGGLSGIAIALYASGELILAAIPAILVGIHLILRVVNHQIYQIRMHGQRIAASQDAEQAVAEEGGDV